MHPIWSSDSYFRLWRFYASHNVLVLYAYEPQDGVMFTGVRRMDIGNLLSKPIIRDFTEHTPPIFTSGMLNEAKIYEIRCNEGKFYVVAERLAIIHVEPYLDGTAIYSDIWTYLD